MSQEYNDLISKTFCDNSIRSVMMIDDEFLPYSECIDLLGRGESIDSEVLAGTRRAANLTSFFHDRKLICDVDNGSDHLDEDRVRKCDLLVLDYHLEKENPSRSLGILSKLRDSKHMNLVVIYTDETLNKAWLQIAASLRGSIDPETLVGEDAAELWDNLTESGASFPVDLQEIISAPEYLLEYCQTGELPGRVTGRLAHCPQGNLVNLKAAIAETCLLESNLLKSEKTSFDFNGGVEGVKWLCIGHVFIALCSKTKNGDDSEVIWDSLNKALHAWKPNFYRLLTSEIQNYIEDGNLAMKGYLEGDYESQAAWLWRMKTAHEDSLNSIILDMYNGLNEQLWDQLEQNKELMEFSRNVLTHCFSTTAVSSSASESYNQVIIEECVANTFKKAKRAKVKASSVVHALNQSISSKPFVGSNITIGTLLRSANGGADWYLCVSPSCDTVPQQYTDRISKRMSPHRLLKFIRLVAFNLDKALENATHSKYIFTKNFGGKRIALAALNPSTNLPTIEYGIVGDHDNGSVVNGKIRVEFIGEQESIELVAVEQLRQPYAVRYQAIASHHAGRIGVDFIPFSSSDPSPNN